MTNPLIITILGYLKEKSSACSLIDLVSLCEQNFLSLIPKDIDPQIVIFQKNFFVMNALYQIQRELQTDGFSLTIYPLDICLVPNHFETKCALSTRDTELGNYYLDWANLNNVSVEEIELLFSSFWKQYSAVHKIDTALATLGVEQGVDWLDIRQAYQKKIIISHPDKGGCADDFIETRAAYEILKFGYQGVQR